MITSYDRTDLLHIIKLNRFMLQESDTAQLNFTRQISGEDYKIGILVIEDLPSVTIKRNGHIKNNEIPKSVDDLKLFLEESL
jgi:5-methylthioribose kinase